MIVEWQGACLKAACNCTGRKHISCGALQRCCYIMLYFYHVTAHPMRPRAGGALLHAQQQS